jgi:hypothetical protein
VAGVTNGGEIYLRDLQGGITYWASTNARALAQSILGSSRVVSYNHALSADGKFVAFETSTNPPTTSSGRGLILRFSLDTGLTDVVHTNAIIPFASRAEDIHALDMTPDGRFVTFTHWLQFRPGPECFGRGFLARRAVVSPEYDGPQVIRYWRSWPKRFFPKADALA